MFLKQGSESALRISHVTLFHSFAAGGTTFHRLGGYSLCSESFLASSSRKLGREQKKEKRKDGGGGGE